MAESPKSLRAIFDEASEVASGEARRAYLDRVCGADVNLRANVEELLGSLEAAGGFLADSNREAIATAAPVTEQEGDRIGRYKLLQKIGEGGCGVVYMAEQTETVRRRVALKIIKLGMDTRSVVARFEAERQALAMMDHPGIARVLDAGATETGRPYFVMELVRGIRITEYCDQNHLSTTARLQLFTQVCHAVQHAHQKGIIHRDLKPSNILVTSNDGVPLPKVIDFGIAKATADIQLTDKTLFTRFEMFIGTPAYMSPEQAEFNASDIDTRTDIYSLGVLLYELLTGHPPFDSETWRKSGVEGIRKAIRETEPARPSTRLTQHLVAAEAMGRDTPPAAGSHSSNVAGSSSRRQQRMKETIAQLRGDLDWIVLKTLEKDRTRRYQTAADLAADIQRHLNDDPVIARPPSTVYLLQKAFHRHRLAFSAGMAVVAALLLGITGSIWQAARAKASERLALRTAYSSDMNLAQQALAANNLGRAQSLLRRHQPKPGQADLRGWEWRYLWNQTRPDEHEVLRQDANLIEAMSCSPDGKLLALEIERQVLVTDLVSRTILLRKADCRVPTFARSSPLLAFALSTSSEPGAAVILDMTDRREVRKLPQDGRILKMSFVANDQQLLIITDYPRSASNSKRERRLSGWDIKTGKVLWQQPIGPLDNVTLTTLAISPDGSLFAVAMPDGRFRVGETSGGRERLTAKATQEDVTALAFAPDGNTIASGAGYTDSAIQMWDLNSGAHRGTLEGHRSWVSSLVFLRDGRQLISSGGDQTIRRWDWSKRAAIGVMRGHQREVWDIALLPDDRTLLSHTYEGELFLWDLDKPSDHPGNRVLPAGLVAAVFTPDSRTILGAQFGGGLASWDLQTFSELKRWRENSPGSLATIRLAADAVNAAVFDQSSLHILNLQTNAQTRIRTAGGEPMVDFLFTRPGNHLVIVVQKPSGFEAQIWGVREARLTGTFAFKTSIEGARFLATPALPNSMVVADTDGLRLWNVTKPAEPPRFIPDRGTFQGFATDPAQKLAAVAFGEGHLRLWDLDTLQEVGALRDFMLGAHAVAFAPDGKRLAAGSNGVEALKLWDVETRQQVLTLNGEGPLFERIAFSPDGRHLFGINAAGTLHLWSAPSWEEIAAAETKKSTETRHR